MLSDEDVVYFCILNGFQQSSEIENLCNKEVIKSFPKQRMEDAFWKKNTRLTATKSVSSGDTREDFFGQKILLRT